MARTYVFNDPAECGQTQTTEGQQEIFRRKYQAVLDAVIQELDWLQQKREQVKQGFVTVSDHELDEQSQKLLTARLQAVFPPRNIA